MLLLPAPSRGVQATAVVVGGQNVTISLRGAAGDAPLVVAGGAPLEAKIVVDPDKGFASLSPGGSLTLKGVHVEVREGARRRLGGSSSSAPLVTNLGGALRIERCVLVSKTGQAVHSAAAREACPAQACLHGSPGLPGSHAAARRAGCCAAPAPPVPGAAPVAR